MDSKLNKDLRRSFMNQKIYINIANKTIEEVTQMSQNQRRLTNS